MIMKIKNFYIFSNTNRSINTHTNRQDLGISYLHIKSFSLVIIDRRNSRKVERNRGWNMYKQDQPWGKPKHWILPFWENGKQSYSEKGFQQVKHYFNKKNWSHCYREVHEKRTILNILLTCASAMMVADILYAQKTATSQAPVARSHQTGNAQDSIPRIDRIYHGNLPKVEVFRC